LPFGIQRKMLTSMTALSTIKILQGRVVTQTILGGLTYILKLQVSYGVHVPKIMKVV